MARTAFLGLPVSHLFEKPSPAAAELASLAEVLEIRAPGPPAWLPVGPPRVFHWGYGIAEDDFGERFPALKGFLRETGPRLFSCDLGPSARRHEGILPTSPTLGEREILDLAQRNLELLRTAHEGRVALENYNFYPTGLYEHVCDPGFMAGLLESLDLGLVLDLAHAAISAWNMGEEVTAYLSRLPLERVEEIHLSRPFLPLEPGRLGADTHECPQEREWSWLSFVLGRTARLGLKPIVLIEYYKDMGRLRECMLRLDKELGGPAGP
jgi:uncharacterized protein (UPF0276 family)